MNKLFENFRKFVNESSLSRVYKHIVEHDCAIISASRNDPNDLKSCVQQNGNVSGNNHERNRDLKAVLLAKRYGVTPVKGNYIEDFNGENPVEVQEDSLFVVNLSDDPDFFGTIIQLGEMFCQDSIIKIMKGGQESFLVGTNNAPFPGYGNVVPLGDLDMGKEAEYMTRVNKRPFALRETVELETFQELPRLQRMCVDAIKRSYLK